MGDSFAEERMAGCMRTDDWRNKKPRTVSPGVIDPVGGSAWESNPPGTAFTAPHRI